MSSTFDRQLDRVTTGERLTADEIHGLADAPDILPLGMLADTVRRRLHGTRVTYLRVGWCAYDKSFADAIEPAAREIRITGSPDTLDIAVTAVQSARAVAGDRTVAGFAWTDVERLAEAARERTAPVLEKLRQAGLDALAEMPLDATADLARAITELSASGFRQLRLTMAKPAAGDRASLVLTAAELQDRFACVQSFNPLPVTTKSRQPTTGYSDVKMVALARVAAPNIPSIQVDWRAYGPKLAQVALTFGADDLYGVSASDAAPEGRRRAPVEEVRRNIESAAFEPSERDGRFAVVG